MRIAIIGAGFAGLATAWNHAGPSTDIVVYDAGVGASSIATGLLHPYGGSRSKLNPHAEKGMAETLKLLDISSEALGEKVYARTGMLRPAMTEKQIKNFSECAKNHADVHWLSPDECASYLNRQTEYFGIFIESTITVDCPQYIKGLVLACQMKNVQIVPKRITSLTELDDFDRVVVTTGAMTSSLPELSHLPLTPVKGQVLKMKWPSNLPQPTVPINSRAYLVMLNEYECLLGATFERNFFTPKVELQTAINELIPKIIPLYPELQHAMILDCKTALRASTPNRQPIIEHISDKVTVLAGLGSKGLLYHALFAKKS